jgi:hypothetical protein
MADEKSALGPGARSDDEPNESEVAAKLADTEEGSKSRRKSASKEETK